MNNQDQRSGLEIAVIGMAGRFPGARNIEEFWENLRNGRESIRFFKEKELEEAGVDRETRTDPNYIKAYGYLPDIECFDASFFGFSPGDAFKLDPQIRLFLETAWQALEHSGYNPERFQGKIGVFAGGCLSIGWHAYLSAAVNPGSLQESLQQVLLSDKDFLAAQTAYKLNLKGPAYVVNTACSTSLVAVDLACKNLLFGACDIALAGGVSISTFEKRGFFYEEGMILAPDGHCRAFDRRAQGTVFGNGLGIVVLKTLERALGDGDTICAVIKGTAVNNDGAAKVGFTAPGLEGEAEVIRSALRQAEVEAESIGYVEAHGTGTALGDPIEIEALKNAFRTDKKKFCRIGSVKTNVGHLNTAAGVTGLIKTILSLQHRQIPASLHFSESNPRIDFENSPFQVNTELRPWPANNGPLRAGVSAFGFGGTNAHVILEEAPPSGARPAGRSSRLLLLSGRTEAVLDQQQNNLAQWLQANPDADLADVAYTLQVGRKAFSRRLAAIVDSTADAAVVLTGRNNGGVLRACAAERVHPVFLFLDPELRTTAVCRLYAQEPLFKTVLTVVLGILETLEPGASKDLFDPVGRGRIEEEKAELLRFCLDYAWAQYLMRLGIAPTALCGQGTGEFAAACLAGVFSPEEGLKLVHGFGRFRRGEIKRGALKSIADHIRFQKPQKAFPSHRSGQWIRPEEALDPRYWLGVPKSGSEIGAVPEELKQDPYVLFIGAGPETGREIPPRPVPGADTPLHYADLFREDGERALAELWLRGIDLKWEELYRNQSRRRIGWPSSSASISTASRPSRASARITA
ncbi:MAG: polyketide synthase, partial [Desulfobacteraceae bacterium]